MVGFKKYLVAAVAVAALGAAGQAGAITVISADGLWSLSDTTFGTGTGIHFVNGQGGANVTQTLAQINPNDEAVLISSSDTFDVTGQGEANIADGNGANADPYLDLAFDFTPDGALPAGYTAGHTWSRFTFALSGVDSPPTTFTLNVNGGAIEFAGCSICSYTGSNNGYTLTALGAPKIDTVNFSFSGNSITTGNFEAKQFRLENVTAPPVVPEPGTWALMILGFGAAGAMLRRRRIAFA
jgi:hypothetical protein